MNETATRMADGATDYAARLRDVHERIARAAERGGRAADDVTLIAVSKTHPVGSLREALQAGATDFGENRVQEAVEKREQLAGDARRARWHLIGHLQANKARRAALTFDVIHTINAAALAARLNRICEEEGRASLPVLVQVDLAGEKTKAGVPENGLMEVVDAVRASNHLRLVGLMTLPPFLDDAEQVRPYFKRLRELRDELASREAFTGRGELSMGMSHDFELAVEEGATMVRVGTSLFGARA